MQQGSVFDVQSSFGGLPVGLSGLITAAASGLRPADSSSTDGARKGTIAVFLPRNSDLSQVAAAVPAAAAWEVERNVLNGHLKGITLYVWL